MTRLASRAALPVLVATLVARAALAQAPSLGDFVLFADDKLKARGLVVESGDVGTNGSLEGTKRIDAPTSRLVANSVDLDKATVCKSLLANSGAATQHCGPRTPVSQPVVGNLASACGFPTNLPTPAACSGDAIIVPHDGSAEKAAGTYSRIDVAGGGAGPGSLVLLGGTYTICGDVTLRRNAQLVVRAPSVIRVLGRIKFDNGSSVAPESLSVSPCQIQIFSNGDRVRVSRRASVQGTICAPNAKLELTAGAKLRGAFYANEVKSDRVTLDGECGAPTTTTLAPPTTSTTTIKGSSTTSTSTTTTTAPALCGNGIVESGEQCDPPGSVGGAFCPAESACTATCQCSIPPTTTSTAASTTSTSTTTSTSSTQPAVCGNGIIEAGEQCDPPGSAGGAFCPPESACTASCQCSIPPTTSSTTEAPTTTSTSTTSTQPAVCGNGIVESGEDCDPPGSAGGVFCPGGADCDATCHCPGVTTTSSSTTLPPTTSSTTSSTSTSGSSATTSSSTSSTAVPTTIVPTTTSTTSPIPTTTSTSSSTSLTPTTVIPTTIVPTTTTSSSSSSTSSSSSSSTTVTPTTIAPTTTTIGGGSAFDFLSTAGSGACGNTYRDLAGTVPLKNLLCGSLSLGGGISQVPDNATPPGATNRFTLTGCVGSVCNIGPTAAGSTPAGVDCTDIGCKFGTPLPISNSGLSVCVTNTFSPVAPSGTLDKATGDATWSFQLNSATILTGSPAQPCPVCAPSVGGPAGSACVGTPQSPCTGVCDGSPNQGAVCHSKNSVGVSSDCPSPAATTGVQKCFRGTNNGNTCSTGSDCPGGLCAQFIGNIAVSLTPLTTGTSSLSSATGIFCPTQNQGTTQHGAFKSDICLSGVNSGKPCDRDAATGFDVPHCGAGIQCRAGTLNSYCVGGPSDGLGCSSAATCPAPGVCSRAGQQVQLIKEIGSPAGALAVGVAKPVKLGSAFCVAATTNPTVNSNANLPGPGATSVTGTITLLP